jgi:hypothetical protein
MTVVEAARTSRYSILGVPVSVTSDAPEALCRVDETYAAFHDADGVAGLDELAFALRRRPDGSVEVSGPTGERRAWPAEQPALLDLLDRLVKTVLAQLASRGIDAIHAGAISRRGRAAIVAGASGHGKTTLTLGLVGRGWQLLSDELAIADPARGIVPYRRSTHVRPGTPELVPALGFVHDLPRHELGGGIEWSVEPSVLERALPGCLGEAAPLRHVLLLAGPPAPERAPALTEVPAALAAMELLKGTWSASVDFAGALRRVGRLLDGAACARLSSGALEPTLDLVCAWLEASGGR